MKRKKCVCSCVDWRTALLVVLLIVGAVILLCLLPRWALCFLILALAAGCAALAGRKP